MKQQKTQATKRKPATRQSDKNSANKKSAKKSEKAVKKSETKSATKSEKKSENKSAKQSATKRSAKQQSAKQQQPGTKSAKQSAKSANKSAKAKPAKQKAARASEVFKLSAKTEAELAAILAGYQAALVKAHGKAIAVRKQKTAISATIPTPAGKVLGNLLAAWTRRHAGKAPFKFDFRLIISTYDPAGDTAAVAVWQKAQVAALAALL